MDRPSRDALARMDSAVFDLGRDRIERFEAGAHMARIEADALSDLARSIDTSLGQWRALLADVDLIATFDAHRAGRLVLESVFDELLAPAPWRVLAAALTLEQAGR